MKKLFTTAWTMILVSLFLASCGQQEPDMEGIILEVSEHGVKLAKELSLEEYEDIKNDPVSKIQNEDVYGDTYRGLIDLTYEDTGGLNKGDEVEVWIDGGIMESYPEKAEARKILVKE